MEISQAEETASASDNFFRFSLGEPKQPPPPPPEKYNDLTLTSLSPGKTKVEAGDILSLRAGVKNSGNQDARNIPLKLFLGQNLICDTFGWNAKSGQEITAILNAQVPETLTPGEYNLSLVADSSDSFKDWNRTDNTKNISIIVEPRQTDGDEFDRSVGYGLINARRAIEMALDLKNSPQAASVPKPLKLDMGQLKSQATWEELNEPLKLLERFPSVATLGDYKLDSTEVAEIHAGGITGQGIIVAVIDTGVDFNHPDLNIWRDKSGNPGWNFPDQNNDTMDKDSHGTHVAGIIAALKNSDKITGIAPDARIMPIKVIGGTRIGTSWDVALGIRYATDNGAKVINLSLGGQFTMPSVEAAITYAASNGVTVVMAAGNAGGTVPIYPAAYARDNGIAVGAIEASLSQAGFSNRAGDSEKMVYLLAPGVSIVSTVPGGRFGGKSGTSMASPVIAGCVALILSANPALTPSQIREILKQTAAHY
jgi:hypothetical protein